MKFSVLLGASLLAALASVPSHALSIDLGARDRAAFERDRQSIIAMAGTYKVRFDVRETASFVAGYEPIPGKISNAHEVVLVAEDLGTTIRLQHLLLSDAGNGKQVVIKHWRQDWVFEPSTVLVYRGDGRWVTQPVSASARKGAWSQTVFQTDDTPRYGGIGAWAYDGGVARWQSNETLRPLARRDAIRHPVYDRYVGANRHALTPTGWVHEQDNAKLGTRDGQQVTFVHEVVINTYQRDSSFSTVAAISYWANTKGYWAEVRKILDDRIARDGGIAVREEPFNGSVAGPKLMGFATAIAAGTLETNAAVTQARQVIDAAASSLSSTSAR